MIPRRWDLGTFAIGVVLVGEKDLGDGNIAQFESNSMTIKIDKDAAEQVQAEACLHELFHAAWDQRFHADSQPDEEEVVRYATATMLEIVRRNGLALLELLETLDRPRHHIRSIKWEKR